MFSDLLTLILICAILRVYQIKTGRYQNVFANVFTKKVIAKTVEWK